MKNEDRLNVEETIEEGGSTEEIKDGTEKTNE